VSFEVVFSDETRDRVEGADSYEQDGPMTTFFAGDGRAARLSSAFAVRVASFRTDRLVAIRRVDDARAAVRAVS